MTRVDAIAVASKNILIKALIASLVAGATVTALPAASSAETCTNPQKEANGQIEIGRIWSGVGTNIGAAITRDGVLLTTYYGADRYIRVSSFDDRTGKVCEKRIDSQFGGWDAHNSLIMAISDDGVVHITGNMHADPLVYAQGPASSLDKINLRSMTSQDETSVTYPHFLKDNAGNLLFLYRSGTSGDGSWQVNRWVGGRWERMPPVFADKDGRKTVSAYPTAFVKDKEGRYHVAVVWRRTMDVASNFGVTYASTLDFQTWQVGRRTVKGPLTPRAMEKVDMPGEEKGLVNNAKLALSATGTPVILFTRYAGNGNNAVFASSRVDGNWQTKEIAISSNRTDIRGGGSIPNLPYGAFLSGSDGDEMQIRAILSPNEQKNIWLNAKNMSASEKPRSPRKLTRRPDKPIAIPSGLAAASNRTVDVRENGVDGPERGRLKWFTQKVNSDRPHECTIQAPKACNPPSSPLIWTPGG